MKPAAGNHGRSVSLLAVFLAITGLSFFCPLGLLAELPPPSGGNRVEASYAALPISFAAHQGQADSPADFVARGRGYLLRLNGTKAELELVLAKGGAELGNENRAAAIRSLKLQLVGADLPSQAKGRGELPGKVHYFHGNDPSRWRTNVPTFARVEYEEVYAGVNLVYYGNQRQLEFDFVVAPQADSSQIRLNISGAESQEINPQGDLVLKLGQEEVRFRKPYLYQEANGVRQEIAGRFVIDREPSHSEEPPPSTVGFHIGAYDKTKPLVIDPVLAYSTYFGGSLQDEGTGIVVDSAGNAYVVGYTDSTNFPTAKALQSQLTWDSGFGDNPLGVGDLFITKFNPTASTLIFSTYLGGSYPDSGGRIALDDQGNVYVAGFTPSPDFPVARAFQTKLAGLYDGFVAKLNPTGSALVYSTYLGGSTNDAVTGIAVDEFQNVYLAGYTLSTNFPIKNPIQAARAGGWDAFVTKLDASGLSLGYSTYLGGSSDDFASGLAIDSAGHACVAGRSVSTNFPTLNAIQPANRGGPTSFFSDAFAFKVNASGSALIYSTYLGGSGFDWARSIAVDLAGNAYLTGITASTNFPVTSGAFQSTFGGGGDAIGGDAFVTKLKPDGSALDYSTYWGGVGRDEGVDIAVSPSGIAYLTGSTASTDFPIVDPIQAFLSSSDTNAFVTAFDLSGRMTFFSTYLGGANPNEPDGGNGIAVDGVGNIFVTGWTTSADSPTPGYEGFPLVNPFQFTKLGPVDAFVLKITGVQPPLTGPPALTIRWIGAGRLEISWPSTAAGFGLQVTENVSPASWANVADVPSAAGGRLTVTNAVVMPARIYRLLK